MAQAMSGLTVTPKTAAGLVRQAIEADVPVLLVGPPGVGKSDITAQISAALEADHVVSHPPVEDPTDPKGLPWPDKEGGTAKFLPFGQLARVLSAKKQTIWNLEDLGHASRAVQGAYMQFVQARRCGEHVLPKCVRIVATTNRPDDKGAGVDTILSPLISRFFLVHMTPHLDDWKEWAYRTGIREEIISYLSQHPNSLYMARTTSAVERTPEPRGWEQASKLMANDYPREHLLALLGGCVGAGAANELIAHIEHRADMTPAEVILKDPLKAPIPRHLSALFATVIGLSYRAEVKHGDAITLYATRLLDGGKGDMAVLLLKDCLNRCVGMTGCAQFVKLASGRLRKELDVINA